MAKTSYLQFQIKKKKCFLGAPNMLKNSDKEKWVYRGYKTAFDTAGSQNFGNDFATNNCCYNFGVDNSS